MMNIFGTLLHQHQNFITKPLFKKIRVKLELLNIWR